MTKRTIGKALLAVSIVLAAMVLATVFYFSETTMTIVLFMVGFGISGLMAVAGQFLIEEDDDNYR